MTIKKSTKKKPSKPYKEYPLFAHANGQWCRKINGKLYSFGLWDNPTAALDKHNKQYASLKEGVTPSDDFGGWRLGDLVDEFLSIQEDRCEAGDIKRVTFDSLKYAGKQVVEFIPQRKAVESLQPGDFRKLRAGILKRFSPVAARCIMIRIRSIFKFAYDDRLISKPVFYGQGFELPAKKAIRKARNEKPKKLFTPEQLTTILGQANPQMRLMVLLGINCGLNNSDCCNIRFEHIDAKTGWLNYPRVKTEIERRAKLWPETVQAFKDYLPVRFDPGERFKELVFITKQRNQWGHSSLPSEFRKLIDAINESNRQAVIKEAEKKQQPRPKEIPDVIPHGSFGFLRHTFATVASRCRDQVAVDYVMGHVDPSIGADYRETVDDYRLENVAQNVHQWLYPAPAPAKRKRGAK